MQEKKFSDLIDDSKLAELTDAIKNHPHPYELVNTDFDTGFKPLQTAILDNQVLIAAQLIEAGAEIDGIDQVKLTAFWYALCKNTTHPKFQACLDLLYNAGIDLNLLVQGKTYLQSMIMLKHLDKAKLLLELGADVNTKDANGKVAIQYLDLTTIESKPWVELLFKYGAAINLELKLILPKSLKQFPEWMKVATKNTPCLNATFDGHLITYDFPGFQQALLLNTEIEEYLRCNPNSNIKALCNAAKNLKSEPVQKKLEQIITTSRVKKLKTLAISAVVKHLLIKPTPPKSSSAAKEVEEFQKKLAELTLFKTRVETMLPKELRQLIDDEKLEYRRRHRTRFT